MALVATTEFLVWISPNPFGCKTTNVSDYEEITYSGTAPQVSILGDIDDSYDQYGRSRSEFECGCGYIVKSTGTAFFIKNATLSAQETDSGRIVLNYPERITISPDIAAFAERKIYGEYTMTTSFSNNRPVYIMTSSEAGQGVMIYTIRHSGDLGGRWILSNKRLKENDEDATTFQYINFSEDIESGMFINFNNSKQVQMVVDEYKYQSELCIDGGNDEIRLNGTFALNEGDDQLFNGRRYYTSVFPDESTIVARLVFSDKNRWEIQYKSKTSDINTNYQMLYYADEYAISPYDIDVWYRETFNQKLKDVALGGSSCEIFDSDILCVVHEFFNVDYDLTGYYYKQDRKYNGRNLYWSMYDLEDDPFREKNELLQSQIWWNGDYWVLDYRTRINTDENTDWSSSKYAYFSFDNVEFPYLVRGWRVFDQENFGKMKTIKPDSCATPTPTKTPTPTETRTATKSASMTPSYSYTPSISITPTRTPSNSPSVSASRTPTFSSFETKLIGNIPDIVLSTYEIVDLNNLVLSELEHYEVLLDEKATSADIQFDDAPLFGVGLRGLYFNLTRNGDSISGGWRNCNTSIRQADNINDPLNPIVTVSGDKLYLMFQPSTLFESDENKRPQFFENTTDYYQFRYSINLDRDGELKAFSKKINVNILKPTPTPTPSYSPTVSHSLSYSNTISRSYSPSHSRSISYSKSHSASFSSFECDLKEHNGMSSKMFGEFEKLIIPNSLNGLGHIEVIVDKMKKNVKVDHEAINNINPAIWKVYVKRPTESYDKKKWVDLSSTAISNITTGTKLYYLFNPEHPAADIPQNSAQKVYSFKSILEIDGDGCDEFIVKSTLQLATPTPSKSNSLSVSNSLSYSQTLSASNTLSYSQTLSASNSLSYSQTLSASETTSHSESVTVSQSQSASNTHFPSTSPSHAPTLSNSYSQTASISYSTSNSYSESVTESASNSYSYSPSISFSYSYSPSESEDK